MSTIRIKGDTSGYVDLASSSTGGNLTIGNGTTDTVHVDNANGRVGIGNSTPTSTLHLGTGYSTFQMGANDATGFHWAKDTSALNLYTGVNGAGNKRFGVSTDGIVTMPYQPAFYVSDGDSLQTDKLKNCANIHVNVGGHWNNTTGYWTVPVAGRYLLSSGVLVNSGSGRAEGWIRVNNADKICWNGTGTTYDGATATAVVTLAANDQVSLHRSSGTVYNDGGHPNTYLSGYLIG